VDLIGVFGQMVWLAEVDLVGEADRMLDQRFESR